MRATLKDATREGTNWRIAKSLKQAVRLAAGALDVQDNEAAERILLLGLQALKAQEPQVKAVLEAAQLP